MAKQTFTIGQVLTAAQVNALQTNDFNQTVTNKTASYTPTTTTDIGTRVIMNSASATTITINTSIYAAGDTLFLSNIGVGVCTLTAGTCTITSGGSLAIPQYGGGTLYFTSTSAAIYYPSAGATVSSGLTLISSTTTNSAAVTVSNCFSSTYRNYLIKGDSIVGCTSGFALELRFGVSGTPTTTGYASATFANAPSTTGYISYNSADPDVSSFELNVFQPNAALKTVYLFRGYSMYENRQILIAGNQTSTNQFTDFVLTASDAAFTSGTIRVYGYANS